MCTKLNLHGARWQQIYHYTCQTYASSHHHIYQSFYLFFYLLFFLNNIHCPKTKSILQRNQNQNQINKKINFFVLSRKKKKHGKLRRKNWFHHCTDRRWLHLCRRGFCRWRDVGDRPGYLPGRPGWLHHFKTA